MPILPLVEQKVLNADTIISPVQELPDVRKAITRKPVGGSPLYHFSNATFAPGVNPFTRVPQNNMTGGEGHAMHSYPPPHMVPQQGGYAAYAADNAHYTNQTYPGLHKPPKSPQIFTNDYDMRNPSYVNMGPVSAVQQQDQAPFTNSPTETTAFPNYYTPDPQYMTGDFDPTMQMQYQQPSSTGSYQAMHYMSNQHQHQQSYPYQG